MQGDGDWPLTPEQAGALLDASASEVVSRIVRGDLAGVRIGETYRIPAATVARAAQARSVRVMTGLAEQGRQ